MNPVEGLNKAVSIFGTEAALAAAIGFTAPAIRRARMTGRPTAEMSCCIEYATRGRVKRACLRPDIFSPRAQLIDNSWNRKRFRDGPPA